MDLTQGTKDARGRILEEGDEIIVVTQGPIFFRVARIAPVLNPQLPPDMLELQIVALIPFLAKRGVVNPEFIRVRTREEAGPMKGVRSVDMAAPIDDGGSER